jgi:hypothetical protein
MIKDADTIKRLRQSGQTNIVDSDARYTFSLVAHCSFCGADAFITRCEPGSSFNRAVFRCSSCFHQFEPSVDSILWM